MAEELVEVEEDVEPMDQLPKVEGEEERASVAQNLTVQAGPHYAASGVIVKQLTSQMEILMLASVALLQIVLTGHLHAPNGVIVKKVVVFDKRIWVCFKHDRHTVFRYHRILILEIIDYFIEPCN